MWLVNKSHVSTILLDLRWFHKKNFGKILPPELYCYLGKFFLPDYRKIPLLGYDLSQVMNLSNNFPEFTPWTYRRLYSKSKYNTIIKESHCFSQKYEINVCQATINNRFSLLKIDFLKVRFGKYYLPIISIESNNSSEFLSKLEELSLVKDFVSFKKKIHDDKILEKGLREIKKILKKDYVFRILTYYPKSKKKISFNQNSIQDLLNDIHYFYQIIYDSRHNFFKLRHIHYLLPKLIKSFKDCKKVFSQPLGQEVSCELRTEESM